MFLSTYFAILSGMDTDGEALHVKHDLFTLAPISVHNGKIAYRISKDDINTGSNQTEEPAFFVLDDTPMSLQLRITTLSIECPPI